MSGFFQLPRRPIGTERPTRRGSNFLYGSRCQRSQASQPQFKDGSVYGGKKAHLRGLEPTVRQAGVSIQPTCLDGGWLWSPVSR